MTWYTVFNDSWIAISENALLERLFFVSLEFAALAAIIAVVVKAARIRSPRIISLLWLLVLAKPVVGLLLGPLAPVISIAAQPPALLPAETEISQEMVSSQSETLSETGNESNVPAMYGGTVEYNSDKRFYAGNSGEYFGGSANRSVSASTAQIPKISNERTTEWYISTVLSGIWILGVAVFTIAAMFDRISLHRLLSRAKPATEQLAGIYKCAGEDLDVTSWPPIHVTEELESPAIAGLFNPVILVPSWLATESNRAQLLWALRHELTHWRHRDPIANMMRQLAQILFFFHPVAWWVGRRWEEAMELACDRSLIKKEEDITDYTEQLYSMLRQARAQRRRIITSGLFATRTQIGRRIAALLSTPFSTPARLGISAIVALMIFGAVALTVGGEFEKKALAEESDNSAEELLLFEYPEKRVISFPENRVVGDLYSREWTSRMFHSCPRALGDAQGDVEVPAGRVLQLIIGGEQVNDLSYLANLNPNDVQWLVIEPGEDVEFDESQLHYASRLKGIRRLGIEGESITDASMGIISSLPSLQFLNLSDSRITSEGAMLLKDLEYLEVAELPEDAMEVVGDQLDLYNPFVEPGEGKREIRIRLIDRDTNDPIINCPIRVRIDGGGYTFTTNSDGLCSYFLPSDGERNFMSYTASPDGYVPSKVDWDLREIEQVPTDFTMAIEKGTTIGGVIQDEDGKPIKDVTVYLLVPGDQYKLSPVKPSIWDYECLTDAKGRWQCDIVPSKLKDIWIRLEHPYFVSDNTYGMTPKPPIEKLRDLTGIMVLKRGLTVSGVVLDDKGKPISGASVLQGSSRWGSHYPDTETDEDGHFIFANCESGEMILTVEHDDYAPELQTINVGSELKPIKFHLGPGHTVRGRILDKDGNPVVSAFVVADTWRGHRSIGWRGSTDSEGRFEWNGAPADNVVYHMGLKGLMYIRDAELSPSDEEHVLTMLPTLKISGKVVDASTGEPMPEFTIVPGFTWSGVQQARWNHRDMKQGKNGALSFAFTEPRANYYLRIEAPGYMPAKSRAFTSDEGSVTFDFELSEGADLDGNVVSQDGSPISAAEVTLIKKWGTITDGRFINNRDVAAETDEKGHFAFSAQTEDYLLAVIHEKGYAQVSREVFEAKPLITIEPWAVIRGTLHIGTNIGADEKVVLSFDLRYEPNKPVLNFVYHTNTDKDGSFSFYRVPAGSLKVMRGISLGNQRTATSHGVSAEAKAGETTEVNLGGTGRPVIGRLFIPKNLPSKFSLEYANCRLNYAPPEPAYPDGFMNWKASKQRAWLIEWSSTEEGIKNGNPNQNYAFVINEDGTFRVDDVEAGDYKLRIQFREVPEGRGGPGQEIGKLEYEFTVPEIPGGRSDEPLDIGKYEMDLFKEL